MKQQYLLLDKDYTVESLGELNRDLTKLHLFPIDEKYSSIRNPNDHNVLSGTYKVTVVYVSGENDVIE